MTETPAMQDPTLEAIGNAVVLGRQGDPRSARRALLAIWQQIGVGGDPFHRCTLAHYLADLYEDPAEALIWDVRALDAADALADGRTQQFNAGFDVAGFLPSLHINIADNLRRLAAFDTASTYVSTAGELSAALPAGPYADQMARWIQQVAELVTMKSVEQLPDQVVHVGAEE